MSSRQPGVLANRDEALDGLYLDTDRQGFTPVRTWTRGTPTSTRLRLRLESETRAPTLRWALECHGRCSKTSPTVEHLQAAPLVNHLPTKIFCRTRLLSGPDQLGQDFRRRKRTIFITLSSALALFCPPLPHYVGRSLSTPSEFRRSCVRSERIGFRSLLGFG